MDLVSQARAVVPGESGWAPLRSWTDSDLASMSAAIGQGYAQWAREWGMRADARPVVDEAGASPFVAVATRHALALLPLHPEGNSQQEARAWLAFPKTTHVGRISPMVLTIGRIIFDDGFSAEPGSIAEEMGLTALEHLVSAVRTAVAIPESSEPVGLDKVQSRLPDGEFGAWSGGVRIALAQAFDLAIYLNGAAAANLVPQRFPAPSKAGGCLTPIDVAAHASLFGLVARLDGVELTLGQVTSLQVGDVIQLPHLLERPLSLVTDSGSELCKAYLGRTGAWRAIEIVGDNPASPEPDRETLIFCHTDLFVNSSLKKHDSTIHVQLIELDEMGAAADSAGAKIVKDINPLHQVKTTLSASVGTLSLSIGELMALKEHQVLRLDQKIEEPVDLLVEGKPVARGQLVAAGDHFAIRITELPVALQI